MKKEAVTVTTSEELIEAIDRGDSVILKPGTYHLEEPLYLREEQSLHGF